jgi:hypothetical protein
MSDDPASKDGLRWEIRRSLIERLRIPWDAMGEMANQQRAEAAIQISTMMDEIEAWRQAMQKAERDIAQVRAERDEARLEVCVLMQQTGFLRGDYANERGWDCFNTNKEN